MDAHEYAQPNTGARIIPGSSANGALLITGTPITRGNDANSALPIDSPEDGENKKQRQQRRKPCVHKGPRRSQRPASGGLHLFACEQPAFAQLRHGKHDRGYRVR